MNTISRKKFLLRSTLSFVGAGIVGLSRFPLIKDAHTTEHQEYRTLGRTGLRVAAVGFGTTLTDVPNVVKKVIDMGINFIDTGRMYAGGKNEEMIGKVVKDVRKNIIIQSKFSGSYKNDEKAIEKSINDSLRALRTDYIDIMLLHSAGSEDDITSSAVMEGMVKARKSGKIRFCGFSSHSSRAGELLRAAAKDKFYDVVMVPYNHAGHFHHTVYKGFYSEWDQGTLEKEIEHAVKNGIGIVAMKTCSAGTLAEKEGGKGSYQAGLKWILRNRNISTMAVSMGNISEVLENIKAMG